MKLLPAAQEPGQQESADIEITGSHSELIETLEQLTWLAATFRNPQGNALLLSSAKLASRPQPPAKISAPVFDLILLAAQPVPSEAGTPGSCWVPLLQKSVLAYGFRIAPREEGLGLEIPFRLMTHLAGVHYPVERGRGIFLQGRQQRDFETSMLVPTMKLKKMEKAIQWHFLKIKSDRSPVLPEDVSFLEAMEKPDSWFQTTDMETLANCRAYLGYCEAVEVQIGTRNFRQQIQPSNLPEADEANSFDPERFRAGAENLDCAPKDHVLRKSQSVTISNAQLEPHQALKRAARQPLLLYDSEEQSAWLVSELSVALQMAHNRLHKELIWSKIRQQLEFAKQADDGGDAALDAIRRCRNVGLPQGINLEKAVRGFLDCIESIKFRTDSHRARGWDFTDLQSLNSRFTEKELPESHESDQRWWDLTKNYSILVLFGKKFGQVITPDMSNARVCSSWDKFSGKKGFLTASMACLFDHIDTTAGSWKLNSGLYWHPPKDSAFGKCEGFHVQELRADPIIWDHGSPATPPTPPQKGAVVFGNSSLNDVGEKCTPLARIREGKCDIHWPLVITMVSILITACFFVEF
jgi:hypothetical protein